ncbi:MAG: glycosyltransferase family 39 protein [Chloroflexota bacterium]|nr:glycosyltransferase family 39 protein [Chloroflexota bacterium]
MLDDAPAHHKPPLHPKWPLLVRGLLLAGVVGLVFVAHAPTHFVSALGRLMGQPAWIDAVRLELPPRLRTFFWLAPVLLLSALALRNRGDPVVAETAAFDRRDLLLGLFVALVASAIRLWPLFREPWIEPDYDEGVYLGGAWLLRDGALPYRDFVFAHLPGSLFMLLPAARLIELWQDNAAALFAARATAALADGVAAGLVYLAARQLVHRPDALLAALVYASDTLVIQYSRGVRLEPLQAPWLAAGALLVLATLNGRRLGLIAGVCLGLGVTIKITAAVVPLVAILVFSLERRWRALRDLVAGFLLGVAVVCVWFVATSGDEIFRQTVLLQLLRPADPAPAADRWAWLLGDQLIAFTAVAMLLGAGALAARAWQRPVASGWLFVCLWLALTLLLFAYGASFYAHYYAKLILPLALLAAALPDIVRRGRQRWAIRLAVAGVLVPLWWGQVRLWPAVDRAPAQFDEAAAVRALPPAVPVLSFVPVVNVLAGRPIAHPVGGPYLLDMFLGDRYLDSWLNRRWPNTATTARTAVDAAEYVVFDPVGSTPLPGLQESFIWQPITPRTRTLLFTRVDQPAASLKVGKELQLLRRTPARLETVGGQRWLIQPLHWRAPATPPPDLALALHVEDAGGTRVAQLDVPVNGGATWSPDVVTTLHYRIPLPATLGAGTYHVKAIVYSWANGAIVPMQPVSGGPPVTALDLLPVVVEP